MCGNDGWKKIKMKRLELKNIRKSYNGRMVLVQCAALHSQCV